MEIVFSFLTLLASACVAQILIDRNEINRVKGNGYAFKERTEARAEAQKVHPKTQRRASPVPQSDRPRNVESREPFNRYPVPLPDLQTELGVRLRQQSDLV
jgi:hypothetical protein